MSEADAVPDDRATPPRRQVSLRHNDGAPTASLLDGRAFTAASLYGKPVPDRQWHVRPLIPAGQVTSLDGDGGMGKTILALQLCICTNGALPWVGHQTRAGGALYLSAEDDRNELHRRVDALAVALKLSLEDQTAFTLLPLADGDAMLAVAGGDRLVETPLWTEFQTRVFDETPSVVILDSRADVFGGSEIDRVHARQFIAMLRHLALRTEAAVVLLSHPSASGIISGAGTSGSTAWNNSVRSRLFLSKPKPAAGDNEESVPEDVRILSPKKANYAGLGSDIRLRLCQGAFFRDDADTPLVDRFGAELKVELLFMELLASFEAQGRRVVDTTGRGYAPAEFAKETNGATKKGLDAAMRRLFKAEKIRIVEEGPPSRRTKYIQRC